MTHYKTLHEDVLYTFPLEDLVYGYIGFTNENGIPNSVLECRKDGSVWKKDFCLDRLPGLRLDIGLISSARLQNMSIAFTTETIAADVEDFRSSDGVLKTIFKEGYTINVGRILYDTLDLLKAPSLSLDPKGVSISIPQGVDHPALRSWYERLQQEYSLE